MNGNIGFEHHAIRCIIGCCPEERQKEQEIFVDLKIGFDFARCAHSDHLKDTINYVRLAEICTELAQKRQYHLQETFAVEALQTVFAEFDVEWGWIKIKKPQALPSAQFATVELSMAKKK